MKSAAATPFEIVDWSRKVYKVSELITKRDSMRKIFGQFKRYLDMH